MAPYHTRAIPSGPSAPHDWGVSWLELLFNFYLSGQRFPVRIETVQGRKTQIQQYVPFDSNEAVARPLLFLALEEQISHLRMTVAHLQNVTTYNLTPVDPNLNFVIDMPPGPYDLHCDRDFNDKDKNPQSRRGMRDRLRRALLKAR